MFKKLKERIKDNRLLRIVSPGRYTSSELLKVYKGSTIYGYFIDRNKAIEVRDKHKAQYISVQCVVIDSIIYVLSPERPFPSSELNMDRSDKEKMLRNSGIAKLTWEERTVLGLR